MRKNIPCEYVVIKGMGMVVADQVCSDAEGSLVVMKEGNVCLYLDDRIKSLESEQQGSLVIQGERHRMEVYSKSEESYDVYPDDIVLVKDEETTLLLAGLKLFYEEDSPKYEPFDRFVTQKYGWYVRLVFGEMLQLEKFGTKEIKWLKPSEVIVLRDVKEERHLLSYSQEEAILYVKEEAARKIGCPISEMSSNQLDAFMVDFTRSSRYPLSIRGRLDAEEGVYFEVERNGEIDNSSEDFQSMKDFYLRALHLGEAWD